MSVTCSFSPWSLLTGLFICLATASNFEPVGWAFVGRETEFARVCARLAAGSGLLIVGEAGMGKTSIARAGLDAARARGARTEWIAGAAGAAGVPLAAVARLVPDAGDGEGWPVRPFRGAVRSLAVPPSGSLVIGLDDAHLVDGASAAVLHQAVVSGNASMLATARRGEEIPEPVAVLVAEGRLERLDLEPLADADVGALLAVALGGAVEGGTVAMLCAAAEGNPMLVRELVHGGLETGALVRPEGLWTWEGSFAAPRLSDLVGNRLKRLSGPGRSAVEVIAVGEPLPLGAAQTVVGAEMLEALDRLELLRSENRAAGTLVRLAHPLYGEVLRATMSPLRRHAVHLDLANAFAAQGDLSHGDVLRVVTWRLDVREPNDPVHLGIAARRALGASDFELAERIARSGLDATGDGTCRLVLALALAGQGRIDDAHGILNASDAPGNTGQAAELVSRELTMFFYGSRTTSAAAAVHRLQHLLSSRRKWPEGSEPLVEAAQAGVLLLEGSVTSGRTVAGNVLEHPRAPAVAQLRALLAAASGAAIACRTADAVAYAEQGLRLLRHGTAGNSAAADTLMELDAEPLLRATCSLAHRFAGRLGPAWDIADDGYRRALRDHAVPAQGLFALALGQTSFAQGRVGLAARWFREAIPLLRRPPALYLVWALGYLGRAAALLGDLPAAQAALAEAKEHCGPTFRLFDCDLRQAEAWIAAVQGEPGRAGRIALDAATAAAGNGQVGFAADAAHDAARLGEAPAAARQLDGLDRLADGNLVRAFSRHAQALADGNPSQLLRCADTFEELGWHLSAAEAAAAASHLLEGSGEARGGAAAAERARACARSCDDVVAPALTQLGPAPMLSDREGQIARLAAAGLSNRTIAARLYISVRTVDNHLHHTYEKLGIASRDELPATLKSRTLSAHPPAGPPPRCRASLVLPDWRSGTASPDDVVVFGQGGGQGVVLARQGVRAGRGGLAQPGGQRGVGEHRAHRVGQPGRVTGRNEQGGVLAGEFRRAADAGGDDGHARAQRFLQDERLTFPHAGQHEHGGRSEQGGHVIAVAGEPAVQPQPGRLALQFGLERPLADDDQKRLRSDIPPEGRGFKQEAEPFLGGQPADGEHRRTARIAAGNRARFRGNVPRNCARRFRGNASGRGHGTARGTSGRSWRRDGVRGDQGAADPAGAGRAHAFFQVRGYAQHRVRAARHDQFEHAVDRAVDAARGWGVVHGDDQGGPGVVNVRPDERQGDRGERPGPQAVRVHHVWPPGPDQAA